MIYKKGIIVIMALSLLFTIPLSASAAVTGPQYRISATHTGNFDSCFVDFRPSGLTGDVKIRIKQYGVHSGEQASVYWKLYHTKTGKVIGQLLNSDYDGTLVFTDVPSGDYQLIWESRTNNDTEGWYQVTIAGGSVYQ